MTGALHSVAGFLEGAPGVTPPSNPDRRGVFLDDVIVELGFVERDAIDIAVRSAQEAEKPFERYIVEAGILDEDQFSRAVAERNGLDHVDLAQFEVDLGAAEMVTRSAAARYSAVPVAFAPDGAVIVAVEDPYDSLGLSDIEVMTRSEVRPAIAAASGIRALIERLPEQAAPPPTPPPEEEPTMPDSFDDEQKLVEPFEEPTITIDPVEEPVAPLAEIEFTEIAPVAEEPEPVAEVPEPVAEVPEPVVEAPEPVAEIVEPAFAPEPVAEIAEPAFEPETELELVGPPNGAGLNELETEIGSLQETARRADELAVSVERRISELKSADDRSARLEADLDVAQRRVEELEARMAGVDTLAEELRATTAKLEEVNRILEGSVA